jgi:hypothetical protein
MTYHILFLYTQSKNFVSFFDTGVPEVILEEKIEEKIQREQ